MGLKENFEMPFKAFKSFLDMDMVRIYVLAAASLLQDLGEVLAALQILVALLTITLIVLKIRKERFSFRLLRSESTTQKEQDSKSEPPEDRQSDT